LVDQLVTLLFAKYTREVAKALPSDEAYPLRGLENARRARGTLSATARASGLQPREVAIDRLPESWATGCAGKAGRSLTPSSRGWAETWSDQPENQLAEASAMLCQWEWLALFVGGGGIELLEAPLS
jgi:hypothetical protein